MRVGIVLQARYASTRLRGKALEPVGGRTILQQCLRRLSAKGVGQVILATTDAPEDNALVLTATRMGIPALRGDRDDVLGRFVAVADAFHLDVIVRATADNPAVDLDAPARTLALLAKSGADYATEVGLPYGAGVEAVRVPALRTAAALAREVSDREHVTPFVRSRVDLFRCLHMNAPIAVTRPGLRVTVDTAQDLEWIRELYFRAGSDMPTMLQLIRASDEAGRVAA
jgi:spore coat polysaccharide biosynthesis protein SpsF (cytidylyltransferase family)